jgi:hypothetical protein
VFAVGLFYAINAQRISMPESFPAPSRIAVGLKRGARTLARWHPLAPLYRKFTFRVGEDVLVRWAREENNAYLGLDDIDSHTPLTSSWSGSAPATLFVADPEEGRFVGEDEMIPLSPSPRKGGVKRYV